MDGGGNRRRAARLPQNQVSGIHGAGYGHAVARSHGHAGGERFSIAQPFAAGHGYAHARSGGHAHAVARSHCASAPALRRVRARGIGQRFFAAQPAQRAIHHLHHPGPVEQWRLCGDFGHKQRLGARGDLLRAHRLCADALPPPPRRRGDAANRHRDACAHPGRRLRARAAAHGFRAAEPARAAQYVLCHSRRSQPWRFRARAVHERELGACGNQRRADRLCAVPLSHRL